jgi:CHAT domain-containing protein
MLRRDYDSELALIRERSPKYAALTQPQPRDLAAIQREVLDADTVLLEYAMGERRSYLWIVTSDGIETAELPARGEIEALARRVCAQITERNQRLKFESAEQYRGRIAQADAEYAVAAQALSRLVLAPAVGGLAKRRVLVVPDGLLHYVPFAALPAPIVPNGDEPLVASHEVVVLPSATTLAIMRDELASREPQPLMAAVVADPVFEATDARVGKGMAASPRQSEGTAKASALARSLRDVAPATATIERLPFTRREAAAIRQLVPASQRLEALDFAASRTTVTGGVLSKYRIVHFATHGLLDSVHPELSGLVLSLVDEQGRERDGFLRAYEIYNLKLPAELVVLSACRTGLGKDVRGEGIVGLTRGFMYAGAARVIVSLWDVSDEATAELMQRFYSAMLGHKKLSPAAALREAQVSLRRDKRWRSPYYWAAFALQGEPK